MILSKSDYMLFLRHPGWLWLKKFDKHKLPPIDANLQAMFDTGNEFEQYAQQLYPDGKRIGFNSYHEYLSLPARTKNALDSGAQTIFQGRFEADGITCIIDVLHRVEDNVYDLIEIKSSTRAKPEHEYDLAFQTIVLEKSSLKIGKISVLHVNNEYVRDGQIDVTALVAQTDVTESVRALIDTTTAQIARAQQMLREKKPPDFSPRLVNQCNVPNVMWFMDWLDIYKSLNPNLDPYSIYSLSYPNAQQIGTLEEAGIELISDMPQELALRPKQLAQIKATKNDERNIEWDKIADFLDTLKYPLYFLDYETYSLIIPHFDGEKPYSDYPFQYSLHVLDSPGGELRHTEYLHKQNSNPVPCLLEKLQADIGKQGTVLTWNMSYEKGCNDRMGERSPQYAEFLSSLNERIVDLMTPFSELWYVDKDFFGSASIKKVLPVLVPELSYKELDVSDGLKARRTWMETVFDGKHEQEREKIMSDLSAYCTLDTLAMVRIWEKLREVVKT